MVQRVNSQYLRLTPELRASHIATLAVLTRSVSGGPAAPPLHWRRFVVVTVGAPAR
jgi:hypothetical protein